VTLITSIKDVMFVYQSVCVCLVNSSSDFIPHRHLLCFLSFCHCVRFVTVSV